MKHELEVKFYIKDLGVVRSRLVGLGAQLTRPRTLETNLRFDTPDEQLNQQKRLLRLRKDDAFKLTYKDPQVVVDGASRRMELEVKVSDFEVMQEILEALGYIVSTVYEKCRAEYHFNSTFITLDEMPFGDFLEIEGETVEEIRAVADSLGLNWEANIPQNYLVLFNRLKEHHTIEFRDMTFENFADLTISPADLEVSPADE